MLSSDCGDDRYRRHNDFAKLANVARVPRAHFGNENVVVGKQLVADGERDSHRRVVVPGRGARRILLRQECGQEVFGGGLAVAARYSYLDKSASLREHGFRPLHETLVPAIFYRRSYRSRNQKRDCSRENRGESEQRRIYSGKRHGK